MLFQHLRETETTPVSPAQSEAAVEQHTHVIEPELLGASPRMVRWSRQTVAARRLLWNLMIGTGLVFLFLGRNDLATWDALIDRGVPITASVHDKHISRGKTTSYSLRYTFYGDGSLIYGSDSVSRSEFEAANIGDTIPVTYLPGSNGEKWQQGEATQARRDERFWAWFLASGIVVGGFALGLGMFELHAREQMRLLQSGRSVVGRVMSGNITTYKNTKHTGSSTNMSPIRATATRTR
jgi:hypothetical protein